MRGSIPVQASPRFLLKEHSCGTMLFVHLPPAEGPATLGVEGDCLVVALERFQPDGRVAASKQLIFDVGKEAWAKACAMQTHINHQEVDHVIKGHGKGNDGILL